MLLDIRTMLILQTLLGILTSCLMFSQWRSIHVGMRGAGLWILSFASFTLGQLLIALRGIIPYVVTVVPANLVLVVSMLSLLYGAGTFLDIKLPRSYGIAALALITVSHTLFGHLVPMTRYRVVAMNSLLIVNSLFCAMIFLRHKEKGCERDLRAVALTQIVLAVIAGFRLYGAMTFPVSYAWPDSPPLEAFCVLAMIVDQVAVSFTLVGLINARLRVQLSTSADEKTLLVREMHHRTKNDFALVESLISLETSELPECGSSEALERVRDRVHSFALLHDRLYHGKTSGKVDAGEYLSLIAAGLVGGGSKGGQIKLRTKVESVETDAGSAVSLGLIVNELITNALKHAFPGGRTGRIYLSLSTCGANARLEVADDGIGLTEAAGGKSQERLGMTLVASLAAQIGGRMERSGAAGKGVRTTLTFPVPRGRAARANGAGAGTEP